MEGKVKGLESRATACNSEILARCFLCFNFDAHKMRVMPTFRGNINNIYQMVTRRQQPVLTHWCPRYRRQRMAALGIGRGSLKWWSPSQSQDFSRQSGAFMVPLRGMEVWRKNTTNSGCAIKTQAFLQRLWSADPECPRNEKPKQKV